MLRQQTCTDDRRLHTYEEGCGVAEVRIYLEYSVRARTGSI